MALNDYTVALLRAIQSGQAYFTPGAPNAVMGIFGPPVDKNGTVGTGNLHFPGEEQFEKLGKFDPSGGFPLFRNTLSGRGANSIYDPNSGFTSNQQLYGGQEGTLMNLQNISIDSSNKVVPASNLQNIVSIGSSGGPTAFSNLAAAIFPTIANIALPGIGTAFSAINSIAQGADAGDVLKNVAINQGISQGLSALGNAGGTVPSTAGTDTAFLQDMDQGIFIDTTDTTLSPAFVQDMSQGIEPLAPQIPETLDPAFVQDMDQGITPEVNLEGGDLGMTEAEAQDQYYRDIGIDPSTVVDTPAVPTTGDTPEVPTEPQQPTSSLTPQQISQLLKLGAGLFGGGGALAAAAQGLMGGGTGGIGGGMAMPTIQAPTPFTGTYSGMNMNDPAYYQQVQQNYNRLFPTTPANVAGPLESWYQTKYVPDTTISNKLFGV